MIVDGVSKSSKIIKSLMVYAHPGSPEANGLRTVNLNEIVDSAHSYLRNKLMTIGVKFDVAIPSNLEVNVIPDKLSQILLNLIGNAADATSLVDERLVRVTAEKTKVISELIKPTVC